MNPSSRNHPILKLLQKCKTLNPLKQIHGQMITTALILHTYPLSRLLQISSSDSTISHAQKIFNHIKNPTIFLYNTLISRLAAEGRLQDALSLYARAVSCSDGYLVQPNRYTFPSLFKACGSRCYGKALHAHVLKFLDPPFDQFVQASLLNFYASCDKIEVARWVFDQISAPDLPAWNSILAAYSRNSDHDELLLLFRRMQESGVRPNEVTLVALIGACADLGALSQGIWLHAYLLRSGLRFNAFLGSALITLYSNCGCLELARQVFDELPERDTFCYNAMIRGLAVYGCGHEALDSFEEMKLQGLVPDGVTLLAVMCACSHIGLVSRGCEYFHSLKTVYRVEPELEHYGCLVDILGRAGRVREAEETVRLMPVTLTPNAALWRSLLGAARVHGDLQVGEVALKHLIQLEPETSGHYVLLSNIYAGLNRYDEVGHLRELMKNLGANKTPGLSVVEIRGEMHEFCSGDIVHPKAKEIYLKVEDMNNRLLEHGHKPGTGQVLFDIEEEEKEDHLLYHSERLAIAFALMESPPKSLIRIMKNLRVCGDCHDVTKLLSRIYDREIIVRDRTRFHHFRDGICSCLDYW